MLLIKGGAVSASEPRDALHIALAAMRQARISTCPRNPHVRLVFVAVALILRNSPQASRHGDLWVWIHQTRLAEGQGEAEISHLERLRFKRMLDWIMHEVLALFRNGMLPCAAWDP